MKVIILLFIFLIQYSNEQCDLSNCPPFQGYCFNNKCLCSKNYMTVDNYYIESKGIYCNYETKSKLLALLLEFFFPFGIGHLYAQHNIMAMIKFFLFFLFMVTFCLHLCLLKKEVGKCIIALSATLVLDLISWIIFQMVDIAGYGLGLYKDGYGVPLF